MDRHVFEDPCFGWVTVEADDDRVTVGLRDGRLELRTADGAIRGDDGTGAAEQGPQRVRRRTFDVEALVGDRDYRLHHTGRRTADLLRDGEPVATFAGAGGSRQPVDTGMAHGYDAPAWRPGADTTDVRAGHLLASRFGVGSMSGPRRLAGAALDAFFAGPGS